MTLTAGESELEIPGSEILRDLIYSYGSRYYMYVPELDDTAANALLHTWTYYISERQDSLDRMYAAIIAEYNAASEYDETKIDEIVYDTTDETAYGHTVTGTGTQTHETTYDSSQAHDVTTYEDPNYRHDTKETHDGKDTRERTDDLLTTHGGSDTKTKSGSDTRTITTTGYKSSPVERIQRELELRARTDITPMIIEQFAAKYLYSMSGRCHS